MPFDLSGLDEDSGTATATAPEPMVRLAKYGREVCRVRLKVKFKVLEICRLKRRFQPMLELELRLEPVSMKLNKLGEMEFPD